MPTATGVAVVFALATASGAALGGMAYGGLRLLLPAWEVSVVMQLPEWVDSRMIVDGRAEGSPRLSAALIARAAADPAIDRSRWGKEVRLTEERESSMVDSLKIGIDHNLRRIVLSCRQRREEDAAIIIDSIVSACDAHFIGPGRARAVKERASKNTAAFETKRGQVEEQIRNLKTEIQDFIRRNGITSGNEGGLTDQGTANNLARLRDDTIRDLTLTQARLDSIDRKLRDRRYDDEDRRLAMQDPAFRQIEQSLHQLQAFLSSSRERFGEEHPQVKDLVQRETQARDRMKVVLDETMQRNLQADKLDFSERVASLRALVERQTQDLTDASKRLQELTAQMGTLDALKGKLAQKEQDLADLQSLISQFGIQQERADAGLAGPPHDAGETGETRWMREVRTTTEVRLASPNPAWCVLAGVCATIGGSGVVLLSRGLRRRSLPG